MKQERVQLAQTLIDSSRKILDLIAHASTIYISRLFIGDMARLNI